MLWDAVFGQRLASVMREIGAVRALVPWALPGLSRISPRADRHLGRVAVWCLAPMALAVALAGGAAAQAERPLAPLDVSSPAATLQSFLTQGRAIEEALVAYLAAPDRVGARRLEALVGRTGTLFDTRNAPPAIRQEVAGAAVGFLYDILLRLPPEDIALALDPITDPESPWVIPGTPISIIRIDEGEDAGQWLFSPRTLSRLPELHRTIIAYPLQRPSAVENWHIAQSNLSGPLFSDGAATRLPEWLTHSRVLDTPLWKLLLTLAIWMGVVLAALLWIQVLARLTGRVGVPGRALLGLSAPALTALLVLAARDFVQLQVNLSGAAFAQVERSVTLLALYLAAAWAVWLTILALVEAVAAAPVTRNNPYHTNLLRLVGKVLALASAGFVAVIGLNEVGVPALGLIAGLGAGGFAVALAARPTVENLFGGLTLFADKPFRVGDFVNYQDGMGVVENIGPRSSRLRGLDGTLTTVPNTDLVTVRITNYTERNHCLFIHHIGLRYETTQDQLQALITGIGRMLADHPMVECAEGMPRVHLVGFGDAALTLEVRANILTTSYPAFLDIQQELLFKIMGLVEGYGSRLATRTQTVLLGRDSGLPAPADASLTRQSHDKSNALSAQEDG